MAKKFIHVSELRDISQLKFSADALDSTYTLGLDGEPQSGTPDIKWTQLVYIKATGQAWTHGKVYNSMEDAPSSDTLYSRRKGEWVEITTATAEHPGMMTPEQLADLNYAVDYTLYRDPVSGDWYDDDAGQQILDSNTVAKINTAYETRIEQEAATADSYDDDAIDSIISGSAS